MKSFDVTSFRDFPLVYEFGDFLKAKIFLHIGNELAHFQRCDAGIGPILKIPRSNSVMSWLIYTQQNNLRVT